MEATLSETVDKNLDDMVLPGMKKLILGFVVIVMVYVYMMFGPMKEDALVVSKCLETIAWLVGLTVTGTTAAKVFRGKRNAAPVIQ